LVKDVLRVTVGVAAEERKCRWDVRTLKKKKSIKGTVHETKVTDAFNPMNVARGILVLIFCTLFI